MRCLILVLFSLVLYSCKESTKETVYFDEKSGMLIKSYSSKGTSSDSSYYYKNDKLAMISYYKGYPEGTSYNKMYNNKRLKSEGLFLNKKRTGKWKFYEQGTLRAIVDFVNVCGEEYPNQEWNYTKEGNLNTKFCNYFTYQLEGIRYVKKDGVRDLKIKYQPMYTRGGIYKLHFSHELDDDFCNFNIIKLNALYADESFVFTVPLLAEGMDRDSKFIGVIEENKVEIKGGDTIVKNKLTYINIPLIKDK